MNRLLVITVLCLVPFSLRCQKARYGQDIPHVLPGVSYPINLHVDAVHYREKFDGGEDVFVIYADAVIDGKKVELTGDPDDLYQQYRVPLGTLRGRSLKSPRKTDGTPLFQRYEVVLPNQTLWRCVVTGLYE